MSSHSKTPLWTELILLCAYKALLEHGSCDFTDAIFSDDEASLVASQTAIGWKHFISGRCSSEWARLQEKHTRAEQLNPKYYNCNLWTSKVIKHIWRSFCALWKICNTDLHVTTFSEGEPIKWACINPLVRSMYEACTTESMH
jgi:hypothetical protein